MDVHDAITNRRSIRNFSDDPVTDDQIRELIDAACWAPSWANVQAWRFIVLRDRDQINAVTECYSPNNPARKCSFSASAVIVACGEINRSGHGKDGSLKTRYDNWYMFDLGMAVQNLSLRAHEMGLGSVVVGSMDHGRVDELLELPEDIVSVVAVPVGRSATIPKKAPERVKPENCAYRDRWNTLYWS